MRVFKRVLMCACLVQLFLGPAFAGEEKEPAVAIGQIVVSEKRVAEKPYVQNVVARETLARPAASGSVLDTLDGQAGVQLRRSGLAGTKTDNLRIRGFGETRLRILADGVSIQRDGSYGSGQVDWGALSPEAVERIEIHRGAGPAKFGNTLGGVVNIVSKQAGDKPKTTVSASGGSHGTWDHRIAHSARKGPVSWSLAAGKFETDGYLRNHFSDRQNFSGRFTLDLPSRFQIGAGLSYSDQDSGMAVYNRPDSPFFDPGKPTADEKAMGGPGLGGRLLGGVQAWGDNTHAEDKNTAVTAFIAKSYDAGRAKIDFRLWNQERTEAYYDAANPGKKIYERKTEAEDNNWALQGEATYDLGAHRIEAGGEIRRTGWGDQTVSYIDKGYFNGSIGFFRFIKDGFKGQPGLMTYQALYLQDRWRINAGLDLEMGLRGEHFKAGSIDPAAFGFTWPTAVTSMDEENLDPRLALIYRPGKTTTLEARFGVTHRYPNSPEYFWWYLNKGSGFFNTDFQSEKALQYELGCKQSLFGSILATVRGYHYDVENYISSTFVPGTGSVYYNIDEVTIQGAEAGLSAELPGAIRIWTNATWQKGEKSGDPWDKNNQLSTDLPDLPERMVNVGVAYTPRPELSARAGLNHVGPRDHITGNRKVTLGAYNRVNLSGSCQFWKNAWSRWRAVVSVENLLDDDYEEKEGYPMPGVTAMAGLQVAF